MRTAFFISIILLVFVFTACSADRSATDPTPLPAHHAKRAFFSDEGELPDLIITGPTLDLNRKRYTCEFQNVGTASANLDGPSGVEYDNVSIQGWYSQDTVYQNDQGSPAGGTIIGISPLG
jgi:hypothetical protein